MTVIVKVVISVISEDLVLYDILSDATKVQWLDTIPAFTWIG
jgi:hypothetical protein